MMVDGKCISGFKHGVISKYLRSKSNFKVSHILYLTFIYIYVYILYHIFFGVPKEQSPMPSLFLRAWLSADEALLDVAVVNLHMARDQGPG